MNPEEPSYTRLTFDVERVKLGASLWAWFGDRKTRIPEASVKKLEPILLEIAKELLIAEGFTRTNDLKIRTNDNPMTNDHSIIVLGRAMNTYNTPLEGREYYEIKGHSFRLDVPKENKR